MKSPPSPPTIPRKLLEAALPPDRYAETVLGDLDEEFVARAERSPIKARLAFWWDALGITTRYILDSRRRRAPQRHRPNRFDLTMDRFFSNVRFAVRRLTKAPIFTLVAILSLGLGIGANTALFSLVNALILRDLPFENVETLVDIYEEQDGFSHASLSYPDYQNVKNGTEGVFTDVAASALLLLQADSENGVEVLAGEAVTGNYFGLLGVNPAAGRLLSLQDDVESGAHPVAVLGHGFWEDRYDGDPGVVGTELRLGGRPYTIMGVAPEDYAGIIRGIVPQVFLSMRMFDEVQGLPADLEESRGTQNLFAKARLAPGATFAEAVEVMNRITNDLRRDYPRVWTAEKRFVLEPTDQVIVNPMIDRFVVPAAGMVMAVAGIVLLIACANLASFLLARAADRRKEIAVRLAMGAGRRNLVGQLLTETIILGGLGGLAGIGLAVWSLRALVVMDLPLPVPITLDLSLDGTVLAFSLAVSLAAGILFGLAPAIQGTNPDLAPTLRDETAGGGKARSTLLRSTLVTGQVAMSMVLLITAGLLVRSLMASSNQDPGFGEDPTGILQVVVSSNRYTDAEARVFLQDLTDRLEALPGVDAVGMTDDLHLNNLSTQTAGVNVDGFEPPPGQDHVSVDFALVDEGFLDAAGIPLLAGRNFDPEDVETTEPVAMVNETFLRRFFPDGEAIGRSIRVRDRDVRVVGVTRDTKVRRIGEEPRPFLYMSLRQFHTQWLTILARTSGNADALAVEMLGVAREMDPEIMVVDSKTMERHLAIMLLPRRMGAAVVAGFAILALVLASIGIYGLVSYAVARRSREVGIRLSLGAEAGTVIRMLTGGGMKLVAIGGVVGLVLAALLAHLLSSLLFGITALDLQTFLAVPAILGAVALLAAWLPARRASRVNPVSALKTD